MPGLVPGIHDFLEAKAETMTAAFDKIKAGLNDALAHAKGKQNAVPSTTIISTTTHGKKSSKNRDRLQRDDEGTHSIKRSRT